MPDADQHRAGLVALEVLFANQAAVLARRHPQPDRVLVVDHDAIGADVDPLVLGIAHDDQVAGADEAPAVELVQQRRRKLHQIDLAVAVDVLEHRPAVDIGRRNEVEGLHAVAVRAHHVERMGRRRQPEGEREALGRVGHARQDAEVLRVSGDVLEQDRRRRDGPGVIDHFRHGAHFEIPVAPRYPLQLADALGARDPLPQVAVGVRERAGTNRVRCFDGRWFRTRGHDCLRCR